MFKELILDLYREWENPDRTFEKGKFTLRQRYNNFLCIIYSALLSDGFSDITDIKKYMNTTNPSMIYLKSRVTAQELEIYENDLEDYCIEEDYLIVTIRGKKVEFEL